MYQEINFSMFCTEFRNCDRDEQFTYEGKRYLYNYFESIEEATDQCIELDVIAICCEYSEEPLNDVLENYSLESLEKLEDNTCVINYDEETGLVLYQVF